MMKLTLTAIIIAALMISCGGKKTESATGDNIVQSSDVLEQTINEGHNARNSLDFQGTYRGTLPTASGEGMELTVMISDSTYYKSVSYVGKMSAAVVEEGNYKWNDAGTTITLGGSKAPNQYFVGENTLIQLDIEGNRIEGELADKYKLAKDLE